MKKLMRRLCLVAVLAGLSLFGRGTPAIAQDAGGSAERLEKLERRVNEMAGQQEQFMHRLAAQMERQGQTMGQPGNENIRQPMPPPGAPHAGKAARGLHNLLGMLFLIGVVCNILMAIWIFTDIRKRGEGSAIFVAMAVVAGIPAALIYSLTRIGDRKT